MLTGATVAGAIAILLTLTDQLSGPIGAAASSVTGAASRMMGALGGVKLAMGAVGLAADAMLVASVKSAIDFQTEMTNIGNNANMSAAQIATMRQTVLQLGQSGQNLDDLAAGFQHVYNLTQNTTAASAELKIANEAAVATGANASETANTLANAMHEYGLDTSTASTTTGQYNDILSKATNTMGVMHLAATLANTQMSNWSESTSTATAVAANLHIPLTQVSAALATLTKHGFPDLANAQTQVTNIMTHMIKPAAAAEKELQSLSKTTGIDLVGDFSAAGLSTKGLTGVMDDLHAVYAKLGLSTADQTGMTMKLLNAQRGGLGMAALLGTGAADYTSILAELNDQQLVNSVTTDQYNAKMQTAGQMIAQVKNDLHEMGIEIGTAILPGLESLTGKILGVVQGMLAWVNAHPQLAAAILSLVGLIGTLAGGAAVLSHVWEFFSAGLGPLRAGIAIFGGDIGALIPVIGILIAAGTLLYLAWQHDWGGIREFVSNVVAGLRTGFSQIREFFHNAKQDLDEFGHVSSGAQVGFTGWIRPLIPLLATLIDWFGLARDAAKTFVMALSGNWVANDKIQGLALAMGKLGSIFHTVGLALHDFATIGHITSGTMLAFPASMQPTMAILSRFGQWLIQVGVPAMARFGSEALHWIGGVLIPAIYRLGQEAMPYLIRFAAWLLSTGIPAVVNFSTQVVRWIGLAVGAAIAFGTTALPYIQRFIAWLTATAIPGLSRFGTQAGHFLAPLVAALASFGPPAIAGIQRFIGWLTGTGLPGISRFATQAAHALGPVVSAILSFSTTAISGIQRFIGWLTSTGLPGLSRFGTQAGHALAPVVAAILSFSTTAIADVQRFISWITGTAIPGVQRFATEVRQIFGQVVSFISSTFGPMWQNLSATISTSAQRIETSFAPIWARLQGAISSVMPIVEAFGAVIDKLWQTSLSGLRDAVQYIVDNVWPPFRQGLQLAAEIMGGVVIVQLDALSVFLRATIPAAIDIVVASVLGFIDTIKTIADVVTGVTQVVSDLLHGNWSQAWADAKTTVLTFISDVKNYWSDVGTWLLQAGMDLVMGLISGITSMFPGLSSSLAGVKSSATGAVSDAASWLVQAGRDLVQGFVDGILEMAQPVTNAVSTIGNLAKGAMSLFGRSPWPSTIQNGVDFVEGFTIGVGSQIPLAVGVATNLATSVITTTKSVLQIASPSTIMAKIGTDAGAGFLVGLKGTIKAATETSAQIASAVVDGVAAGALGMDQALGRVTTDVLAQLATMQDQVKATIDLDNLKGDTKGAATAQSQLDAIGSIIDAFAQKYGTTVADVVANAQAQLANTQIWTDITQNIEGIIDGSRIADLQKSIQDTQFIIAEAQKYNAPPEYIGGLQQQLAQYQTEMDAAIKVSQDASNQQMQSAAQTAAAAKLQSTAWKDAFSNLNSVIDGSRLTTLSAQLQAVNQEMVVAKNTPGIDQTIVTQLLAQQTQLQTEIAVTQSAYQQLSASGAVAAAATDAAQAAASNNFANIINGTAIPDLEQKIKDLINQRAVEIGSGAGAAVIAGLNSAIQAATAELQASQQLYSGAVAAGIVKQTQQISDKTVAQIQTMEKQMADGGASMMNDIAAAVESGTLSVANAVKLIPSSAIPALQTLEQQLTVQLAQAFLTGTDPGPIEKNIKAIEALLAGLGQSITQLGTFVQGLGYDMGGYFSNVAAGAAAAAAAAGGVAAAVGGGGGSVSIPIDPSTGQPYVNATPQNLQDYYAKYGAPYTVEIVNGQAQMVQTSHPNAFQNNYSAVGAGGSNPGSVINHNVVNVDGQVIHNSVNNAQTQQNATTISAFGSN